MSDVDPIAALDDMSLETMNLIYCDIILGVPKERSRFVDEPGFDLCWDRGVAEVNRMRSRGVTIEIPFETP